MGYSTLNRKLGDGYTYYKFYTPNPDGATPYGEETLPAIIADNQTFGGTDPSGAEISIEREVLDDEVSQEVGIIQKLIVGESGMLKLTVEAGKLNNLAIASGQRPSAVTNVTQGSIGGSNPGRSLLIGGQITLDFFGLVHRVCNSVSPNLKEYLYAPRCQADPSLCWGYKKNEIRKLELTVNIFPALQDGFVASAACDNRHALVQVVFEYV